MDEKSAFNWIVGILIVLLVFTHAYPGAAFVGVLMLLACLLAFFYILKGAITAVLGGEYTTFWTGCAIAMVLVLFFGQASTLQNIFAGFFSTLASLAKAALTAL